jgi:hypothetical protein
VWKGNEFEEDNGDELMSPTEFVEKVIDEYWGCRKASEQMNI